MGRLRVGGRRRYRAKFTGPVGKPQIGAESPQLLANIATIRRAVAPGVVSHFNAEPVIDIYGSVQDTDLGFVSSQINRLIAETKHELPRGSKIAVRGHKPPCTTALT